MSKAPCTCSNYDRIQCAVNLTGFSRFEIIILAIVPSCHCECHLTEDSQPISEATWRANRTAEPEKVRAR